MLNRLLADYCKRNKHKLVSDEAGHAGYIETSSGRRRFFRGCHFDLNPLGAAEIADDKTYTLDFLKRDGFSVPHSMLIHANDVLAGTRISKPDVAEGMKSAYDAVKFANGTDYPVFLKPNKGQEGEDVVRLTNRSELEQALSILLMRHSSLMIQKAVLGDDLRILVLDGEVLCALIRQPVHVEGDGERSVEQLANEITGLNFQDSRIDPELARQGLKRTSVPDKNQMVELLANKNLSTGSVAKNISDELSEKLKTVATDACKAIGLRYAGIDIIVDEPENAQSDYAILEVNAAPGLNRYAAQGEAELKMVTEIYERVFDALIAPNSQ
ncbi:MAG: ATP-grasp domain-containing protein [Roseibium sp.]